MALARLRPTRRPGSLACAWAMPLRLPSALPQWSLWLPVLSLGVLAVFFGTDPGGQVLAATGACLVAAVVTAVHHAEVVAHKVGEPFGTLMLAVAVTVIEVALIVALMLAGGATASALARDTVFAAIMIVCNGVVGLCVGVGGLRHRVLAFRVEGTSPTLAVLVALATLTLVLPTFTTSSAGPTFPRSQLVFAGVVSLALYAAFVFVQTVRHRVNFLPEVAAGDHDSHAAPPSTGMAWLSLGYLLACQVAVLSLWFPHPLELGLAPKEIVLLTLTFIVGTHTLGSGRATVLQGAVHLVLFAVFLFLAVVP